MMRLIIMVLMFFLINIGYSSELLESYKITGFKLPEAINLGEYHVSVHGNDYSINEWWKDQPKASLVYEGEAFFTKEIEDSLKALGFLLGSGEKMSIKTKLIQDRFLYLETVYDSVHENNMDSLILISHENQSQIQDFFYKAYGDNYKVLPKLILVHTDRFFQANGEILYKGPEYTVLKTFEERLQINIDNQNLEFKIPFYPVLYLNLLEKQYLMSIKTESQQEIILDGEKHITPIQIYLDEGVHELEYSGRSQFIYLKKDMLLTLDDVKKGELVIDLNTVAQVQLKKDGQIVKELKAKYETISLLPGEYQMIVVKKGYRDYEKTIQIVSGERSINEVVLHETPGTIIYRMKLSKKYSDLFFEKQQVVLVNSVESLLIDIEKEKLTGIQSKVMWFNGEIIVCGNKILDRQLNILWESTELIINAIKTSNNEIWVFTSSKKVLSIDINTWTKKWTRKVNYLADKIIISESNICILDPYSRIILINTEIGYRDYFDLRLPSVTGISFWDETNEKIRIKLEGYNGYIDYYYKSHSTDLRKITLEETQQEFKQIGNILYQNEKPLIKLSGSLQKMIKRQNHLAIITNEEMVVCTTY